MTDRALAALRLYENYERMAADRGGKNGPRGSVYQAFLEAKAAALAEAASASDPINLQGSGPAPIEPREAECLHCGQPASVHPVETCVAFVGPSEGSAA